MWRKFKTPWSRTRENQGEGVRWVMESNDEHNGSAGFWLQRTFGQLSIPASYDSHLLSPRYWWESQKIREGMKRKFVPCQVNTAARDTTTPGKATEEEKYSSDGSRCLLQSSAEPFSKSFWMSCLATDRKAQWSIRLLCWAFLAQVSVRLTLASGKAIDCLIGLVMVLKYGPLSSKEKFGEVLESKSKTLCYCHQMLYLKDYFSRKQKLGFQIFPDLLKICTLSFHLFLLT